MREYKENKSIISNGNLLQMVETHKLWEQIVPDERLKDELGSIRLGGAGVLDKTKKYVRSNTSGITSEKYFKIHQPFLDGIIKFGMI